MESYQESQGSSGNSSEIHGQSPRRRTLTPKGYLPHVEKDNLIVKYEFTDAELEEIDSFTPEEIENIEPDAREQIGLDRAKAILKRSPREPQKGGLSFSSDNPTVGL